MSAPAVWGASETYNLVKSSCEWRWVWQRALWVPAGWTQRCHVRDLPGCRRPRNSPGSRSLTSHGDNVRNTRETTTAATSMGAGELSAGRSSVLCLVGCRDGLRPPCHRKTCLLPAIRSGHPAVVRHVEVVVGYSGGLASVPWETTSEVYVVPLGRRTPAWGIT